MALLTLDEIAAATEGRRIAGDGAAPIGRYAIDSRAVAGGELFFALRGARHDGHDFLPEAFRRGAAAAVVSREVEVPAGGRGLVLAPDTTRALQQLAAFVRRRARATVVGITGSGGKTTCKEMTAAALAAALRTHRSRGNFNNAYGLPLCVLEMPERTEALVLEMGMSWPGEIARLVEIADPDVGVLLNISEVHREHFASIDEIARAKGELLRGMRSEGLAVFNTADPRTRALGEAFAGRRISFAVEAEADARATDVRDDIIEGARFSFRWKGAPARSVALRLYGRHNVANAAAALAVALALGVEPGGAIRAVEAVGPVEGRGVVERMGAGVVLVDETYNSNPAALASVLESLASTRWTGRRVLASGDMLELGDGSASIHREAGARAARAGVGLLVAVGPLAAECARGAREAGLDAIADLADSDEAAARAAELIRPGDLVVVKGSRGIAMERFAQAVRARYGPGGAGGGAH